MKGADKAIAILLLLLLTAGCSLQNLPAQKPQPQQQSQQGLKQVQVDPGLAQKADQTAKTVEGVEDSVTVVVNKNISTAIKVSGFDRLRLKSIKEEVHKKLNEANKDYEVHVTSDKKLFMQLQQIEKQITGPRKQPLTDIQKKVEKINKAMKG